MTDKLILDATCGCRTIWFQKNEPHTIYCDKRREEWEGDFGKTLRADEKKKHRHLVIDPDVQCDFTDLPFDDNYFNLFGDGTYQSTSGIGSQKALLASG